MKVAHDTPNVLRRAVFDFSPHKSQEENYRTAIFHSWSSKTQFNIYTELLSQKIYLIVIL